MPVYTETKTYHTKAHMGMIDVTDDFRAAVQNACRKDRHAVRHDPRLYHRRCCRPDHAGV